MRWNKLPYIFHNLIVPNYIWTWVQSNYSSADKYKKEKKKFPYFLYAVTDSCQSYLKNFTFVFS